MWYTDGDVIYIPFNKSICVSCYASGSRPSVNISVTVDGMQESNVEVPATSYTSSKNVSFQSHISFYITKIMESGYITCQSSPLKYFRGKQLKVKYYTYGKTLLC